MKAIILDGSHAGIAGQNSTARRSCSSNGRIWSRLDDPGYDNSGIDPWDSEIINSQKKSMRLFISKRILT